MFIFYLAWSADGYFAICTIYLIIFAKKITPSSLMIFWLIMTLIIMFFGLIVGKIAIETAEEDFFIAKISIEAIQWTMLVILVWLVPWFWKSFSWRYFKEASNKKIKKIEMELNNLKETDFSFKETLREKEFIEKHRKKPKQRKK